MCRRIYTLLEIINIILCIHYLYGKKPHINIRVILLICADVLIFEFIESYNVNSITIVLLYLLVFVYTLYEFKTNMRECVINNILYFMSLGIIQLFSYMLLLILRIEISSDEWLGLYINIVSIFTTFFMRNILASLFALVSKKRGVSVCVIVIFCIVLFDAVLEYKRNWEILADDFLIITVFGCLIVVLSYYWQLEREKVHIQEIELRLHNLYDSSFKEMIQVMQEKQHDFHNHIQAIKSQHYTIHTYEELVKEQEKYCDYMIKDNKFFHLLNSNSSVLTGFLYGKFIEADKDEIEVRYSVRVGHHIEELPEYILIEIIGVLWDNAVEAVKEHGDKVIVINIRKNEEPLLLEVGNPIFDVSYAELQRFFKRGYSNKEAHSGIGLHKLYQYSEKYGYNLIVDKGKQEGKDWLFIKISFEAVHTLK